MLAMKLKIDDLCMSLSHKYLNSIFGLFEYALTTMFQIFDILATIQQL